MTIHRNSTTKEEAKFTLIRELTFQIHASEIDCGIYVPEIISTHFYFKDIEDGDIVCEILMPKIVKISQSDLQRLDDDSKQQLFTNTKRALNCLRENAIYHNDTHSNNVLFVRGTEGMINPCLIDFGKAYCNQSMPTTTGMLVNNDDVIKEFNTWILGKDAIKYIDLMDIKRNDGIYGGLIKRKTKKRNNKKKKNTKKKRITIRKSHNRRKTRRGVK
jgi:hypothetical protein